MAEKNSVAKILQFYAFINAIAGFILMFIIADSFDWMVAVLWLAMVVAVNFLIYAFGEIIELLAAIKDNTSGAVSAPQNNELPDI